MKKKLLSLIAVAAAIATAGGALIACGGDNDDVKREVTAEQWAAAFDVDNFTSDVKIFARKEQNDDDKKLGEEVTLIVGPEKFGNFSTKLARFTDGTKIKEIIGYRIVEADGDYEYKQVAELTEDNNWVEHKWIFEKKEHVVYDIEGWQKNLLNELGLSDIMSFADKYDKFKYENGGYTLLSETVIEENGDSDESYSYKLTATATNMVVKFADSKLDSVEMTVNVVHESQYGDNDAEIDEWDMD